MRNQFKKFFLILTPFLFVLSFTAKRANGADWLLDSSPYRAEIKFTHENDLVLSNGLAERRFRLSPNLTTVSFKNLVTGEELVRAVSPEAVVELDGKPYPVGGMTGAPVANYLKEDWFGKMTAIPDSYRYRRWESGEIEERFPYKRNETWLTRDLPWPPKGKRLRLFFDPPETESETPLPSVEIRYEIYDGIPLLSKRVYVRYADKDVPHTCTVTGCTVERIRIAEEDAAYHYNILATSDYTFGTVHPIGYIKDPVYPTQVSYTYDTRCVLSASYPLGPAQTVSANEEFESFGVYELLWDTHDRERRGLEERRMMRTLAPWIAENPLMFHKLQADPDAIREGIEQCRETGFETLIMSFGSGFNLESRDEEYHRLYKTLSREAKEAGIALGGYSLTSSRDAEDVSDNVVNPAPCFARGPCLGSVWGAGYIQGLKDFMEEAEFGIFENDGPYPGDFCESAEHPGHRAKEDSVWNQFRAERDFYRWCRGRGIYLNQPDNYFLDGGSKSGMGYRETNWSLPRAEQVIIERQNIYDGTWNKNVSAGWMFVPLAQYHGGGEAATIEPLSEHLDHYDARFADLIGAGVQACWRGPRLYDTDATKAVVVKWVSFYKKYRTVLNADLIHLRRADGRDWDGWLHADPDPNAEHRGLAFFYNPTLKPIKREITVPLYYTGLTDTASVRYGDSDLNLSAAETAEIGGGGEITVTVEIPAEKYAWILIDAK